MTGSADEGFEATVVQKVGPVKATFRGQVTLEDVVEGESCTITGEGKGGPAGFAKGAAKVALAPIPEGTRLSYEVDAKVGGKLAQLGSRVIDGFAKKMADQFFTRFQEVLEGPSQEEAREMIEEADPEKKKGWLGRLLSRREGADTSKKG